MDPWKLIEAGRYAEAIKAYTARLRRDKSPPNYCNRGIVFLEIGEFDKALADFQSAHDHDDDPSTTYLEMAGVANWLAGRECDAASIWHDLVLAIERGKVAYADGAGGVESACLLWFAAVRLEQDEPLETARRVLEGKVRAKHGRNWTIDNWPGPIARFLLGLIDETELRERVVDVPIARERELCQAEFYIGVQALRAKDGAKARRAFRKAAELHDANIENEYYLARRESKRRNRKGPPANAK